MSLISRMWPEYREYPPKWFQRLFGEGRDSGAGVEVGPETALTYAAFYCAIDLISNCVAMLPLFLYERTGEDVETKARKHPAFALLYRRPNPQQTAFLYRKTVTSWLLRWGNSLSEIVRDGTGRPVALYHVPWNQVTVEVNGDGSLVYIQRPETGESRRLDAENALHLRLMGDGIVGKSLVSLFRDNIGLGLAAERAGARFYKNGMRPSGVLSHPGVLDDKAFNRLKRSMRDQYSGVENTGNLMLIEDGMKYESLSIPPEDAQYIETRVHGIRDVARITHVPPHKLADLADATFSNVEEMNMDWLNDCIGPHLENWEQELDFKMLLPSEQDRMYFRHNVTALLRANASGRATFYRQMFEIGGLTINEIRRLENLNPIGDDGDKHYVPANLVDAASPDAGQPVAPAPAAPPPASATPTEDPSARARRLIASYRAPLLEACRRMVRGHGNDASKNAMQNVTQLRYRQLLSIPTGALAAALNVPQSRVRACLETVWPQYLDGLRAAVSSGPDAIVVWQCAAAESLCDDIESELRSSTNATA